MNRDLLVGSVFRNAARAVPDRVAVALGAASLSFAEVDRRSDAAAAALVALGVAARDRVALWSETSLDAVSIFAGLAKIGAVFAPISPHLSAGETAPLLETIRPALLLADAGRLSAAGELGERAGSVVDIAEVAAAREGAAPLPDGPSEDDPHVIFLTSGSTGRPKAAVISHRVSVLRTHPGALLEPRGAKVCPYPLFHMAAWTIALQQWQARDLVVFLQSADPIAICDAVERHRATRLNCVPAVWRRILDHLASPEGRHRDLSTLRFADSGTSATPLELLEAIEAALPGACIRVFYGSTEAGSVASLEHADMRRKPGSCGVPALLTEVRIAGTGELLVRSPLLFDGYFDDADATASALADGWYHSGDLADVDEEGYITIVGRASELIRTGGESVAPAEVESVLATHALVADVAVVGLPDPHWGEVVAAVVVPASGAEPPALQDLRRHCEGRLASFKHPRRLFVVNSIPRTGSTGQVQRRLLVEQLG